MDPFVALMTCLCVYSPRREFRVFFCNEISDTDTIYMFVTFFPSLLVIAKKKKPTHQTVINKL